MGEAAASRAGGGAGRWRELAPAALLLGPLVAFLLAFYVAPFGVMLAESLQPWRGDPDAVKAAGRSIYQYEKTIESARSLNALARTFRIALLTTLITLALSLPVALLCLRASPSVRSLILLITFASLAASLIVRNYGWVVVLADGGPINRLLIGLGVFPRPQRLTYNEAAIIVALVHYCLPFMILPIYGSLLRIPPSLWEAPRALGAGSWTVLRTVILPLAMPGIFGGTTLCFAIAMSAFVTPLMLGAPSNAMISQVAAEQFLVQLNFPWGSAIIFLLTGLTFLAVLLYTILVRKVLRVHV